MVVEEHVTEKVGGYGHLYMNIDVHMYECGLTSVHCQQTTIGVWLT